jgi:iron complex outermembrane receptor protein
MPASDIGTAWSAGYAVVDLRAFAGRRIVGGVGISPSVSVSNLLDTFYDASLVANAARDRFFEPGPGRSITVGLSIDWLVAPH